MHVALLYGVELGITAAATAHGGYAFAQTPSTRRPAGRPRRLRSALGALPPPMQKAFDLYHWSSERFSSARTNTISVLLAKGRARVGVVEAATNWPKRIRNMQYLDREGIAVF